MTKFLNTHLSQHEVPAPRAAKRPRTWLVALLGFGAADLLVLNLWAVPNLITNTTTTDMRAARSGDMQPGAKQAEPQPEGSVYAQQAEPTPNAEPAPEEQELAQRKAQAAEQAAEQAEPTEQVAEQAAEPTAQVAEQPAERAKPSEHTAEHAGEPQAEEEAAAPAPQPRAPRAEAPPGGAPPAPAAVEAPVDPAVTRAVALRAAKRAVHIALQDPAAVGGTGLFAAPTDDEQPLTQIFFSLGNFSLGPNGKRTLERTLPQLTGTEQPVLIVGSADPSGNEQINSKLSDARAQSVAEWLLAHGVDAQRIQTRAIGHEGAVGSTLDRRVDIWLGGSR